MNIIKSTMVALAGLCFSMAAACQTDAQSPPGGGAGQASSGNDLEGYRLGSGDEIKITVFGEPNLSGPKTVDGLGAVSLDLVGSVSVKNLTLREAQNAIETRYMDGFLREPKVSVEMVKGRPYYILGEVNKAGEYPFTSGLTVMNAIAAAGDFTYRADKRKIMITGADSGVEREVQLTPSTPVRPGDRIRIRERLF
jgi:protein involved in polysaccharide export with SLBB domain